jgi:hypothetical protein
MFRNFALIIAALSIAGTGAFGVSTASAQTKSTQKGCYNAQTCDTECRRSAVGKNCTKVCARQAATLPACK